MARSQGLTNTTAARYAKAFGALVRERREAQKMTQDDLALAAGVGRRFVIELEAGKPTTHLGKALAVAMELGLRPLDLMAKNPDDHALLPDLPEIIEEPSRG
jgi:y4mF family transcriptional regulator